MKILECDTKLMISPLTKGYLWFMRFQFPFPSYNHLVQELRRRPTGEHVEKIWQVLSDSYDARFTGVQGDIGLFFKFFSEHILQAWEIREAEHAQLAQPEVPRIVVHLRNRVMQTTLDTQNFDSERYKGVMDMNFDDFLMNCPSQFLSDEGQLLSSTGN